MKFLKKKFSLIILIFSFFLLIYVFYKSEIIHKGNRFNFYFIYYIFSSFLIFFSLITFFLNQKIKEYLIITVLTFIISIYAAELFLSLPKEPHKVKKFEKLTGKKWDKRSKLEIYNDLKIENNKITVTITPHFTRKKTQSSSSSPEIFPLGGVSNSETIYCNENGYYSIYQSDRHGFNNPDEEWDNEKIEYLLVGDSFAHGACVNRPNDIASVLRILSHKSVLNLGYSNNDPLIYYATLREYLNSNVDKVILFFYEGNDLSEQTMSYFKDNFINLYIKDLTFTQNLKTKQSEIDNYLKNEIDKEYRKKFKKKKDSKSLKFYQFIKLQKVRSIIYYYLPKRYRANYNRTFYQSRLKDFKEILILTKNLIEKNNSNLYIVYLPEYERYLFNYDNTIYNEISQLVNQLKIPFIDIHKEVFKKEQDPLKLFPFGSHGHYNIEGYKKVADVINKFTKK